VRQTNLNRRTIQKKTANDWTNRKGKEALCRGPVWDKVKDGVSSEVQLKKVQRETASEGKEAAKEEAEERKRKGNRPPLAEGELAVKTRIQV